jgi:hypothetical protein
VHVAKSFLSSSNGRHGNADARGLSPTHSADADPEADDRASTGSRASSRLVQQGVVIRMDERRTPLLAGMLFTAIEGIHRVFKLGCRDKVYKHGIV